MIKKVMILILAVIFFTLSVSAERFTFTIGGSYMSLADAEYGAKYGDQKYFPEGKLSFRFMGNFYLWGSFGLLSSKFTWKQWSNKGVAEADLEGKSVADKHITAGGIGYYIGYIAPGEISLKLETGICMVSDTIEDSTTRLDNNQTASLEESKKSAVGFRGNFGVTYGLFKSIFAEVSIGYIYAPDKVEDTRVNLGGLRASLGLGLKF
jgi:hypothetical protein